MNILVVSPHPDDETLGAGGTILKYKAEGHKIYWLNITNMDTKYGYSVEMVEKRSKEIQKVAEQYNFDGVYDLKLEPAGLDKYSKGELIQSVSKIIQEIEPNTVVLPYKHDIHSDHNIVFNAVYACTKVFRYNFIKKILCMEVVSETDFALPENSFSPNYFVNITPYLDKKISIMNIYESEVMEPPFPRSSENIKALATLRGSSSGNIYAEAFVLLKYIEQ